MNSELSFDEARRLVQAQLDSWRTSENEEHVISGVTPFEHGWVFDYEVRVDGNVISFDGGGPLAVFKTGEVVKVPGVLPTEVVVELLSRNWEAAHAPALSVELSEKAEEDFSRFFKSILSRLLRSGAEELRIEEAGRIRWRIGSDRDEEDREPFFIGALIARRLKVMADIDPADLSEAGAMQSGLIKIKLRETRYKMVDGEAVKQDGQLVVETRKAFYNISLTAFPTGRGEQIILSIELDEATSTWALSNET